MRNEYRGEWTEQERRVVDRHFRGWILHKTRHLYRAQFRRYEITAVSLNELMGKAGDTVLAAGAIVPRRTMDDIKISDRYPNQVDPESWDESLLDKMKRNKARLIEMLGR